MAPIVSRRLTLTVAMAAAIAVSACQTSPAAAPTHEPNPAALHDATRAFIDALVAQAPQAVKAGPVLVATFVDVDRLEQSTTLGRMITELAMTRLVQKGLTVTEVKLRHSLYVKQDTGELMLSRELSAIAAQQAARAVLVGTYAAGRHGVHVAARLVEPATGVVLAAQDAVLPLDTHLKSLLR